VGNAEFQAEMEVAFQDRLNQEGGNSDIQKLKKLKTSIANDRLLFENNRTKTFASLAEAFIWKLRKMNEVTQLVLCDCGIPSFCDLPHPPGNRGITFEPEVLKIQRTVANFLRGQLLISEKVSSSGQGGFEGFRQVLGKRIAEGEIKLLEQEGEKEMASDGSSSRGGGGGGGEGMVVEQPAGAPTDPRKRRSKWGAKKV
jgi:hypothetical protein